MTTNHQAQHQQQQHEQKQRRAYDMSTVEECYDGTICENNSRCVPHPFKEGSYMCDCKSVIRDAQVSSCSMFAVVIVQMFTASCHFPWK
mmetsp:Transcript_4218/g.8975  ORF Transcript_4218/g.8975 Transcript_4218/m.8975 type:complete len:89 (-) Transcript_4218:1355-1621(-)